MPWIHPKFNQTIIPSSAKILVTVSGGADSTMLLCSLIALKDQKALNLVIGHVNHGLRGQESDLDEKFVRDLAQANGIPVEVLNLPPDELKGANLQARAHQIRWDFFYKTANKRGLDFIATGHQAGDRAETVLYNILRGTGLKGLASLGPKETFKDKTILRPLLNLSPKEIRSALSHLGQDFREDKSNLTLDYDRNRLRLQGIPFLEELLGRKISEPLLRLAKSAAEDEEYLDKMAKAVLESLVIDDIPGGISLDTTKIAQSPKPLRRRILRKLYSRVKGNDRALTFAHLSALDKLISLPEGTRKINLPGLPVRLEYKRLTLTTKAEKADTPWELPLSSPGRFLLPGQNRTLVLENIPHPQNPAKGRIQLDPKLLDGPLCLRNRRPGDIFVPPGHQSPRKLKRLFIDRKIPKNLREKIPLLATGSRIVAILEKEPEIDSNFATIKGEESLCIFFCKDES